MEKTDIRFCLDVAHLLYSNSSLTIESLLYVHRMHNDGCNDVRGVNEGTRVHKCCFGNVESDHRLEMKEPAEISYHTSID